jgi:hypothetical protein
LKSGLPDGIFSNQKSNPNLGKFWKGLAMKNVGLPIERPLSIVWPFGLFFPFWCVVSRKIWQPYLQ